MPRKVLSLSVKKFVDDYSYRIDLDADYQREKIWSRKDQEKLLDSIIENIDIPKLYLARVKDDEQFDYECIDGKQRMTTLLSFLKPEPAEDNPLTLRIKGEKYTYKRLKEELPGLAEKLEGFELTFVIYPGSVTEDEEFLREIFRRLQLGVRLNSGELLKTFTGTLRDFIYKSIGNNGPFLRFTKLSEKRFSRPFTLAQICINSFARNENGEFVRARYDDLADFINDNYGLRKNDENLIRIKEVLQIMDSCFKRKAESISSRAAAVSAYLFVEELYVSGKGESVPEFVKFYVKLLEQIKDNMELLSQYKKPTNPLILEDFQKYILQASVEPYSIKRRHQFLVKAFQYYRNSKPKGKIIRV